MASQMSKRTFRSAEILSAYKRVASQLLKKAGKKHPELTEHLRTLSTSDVALQHNSIRVLQWSVGAWFRSPIGLFGLPACLGIPDSKHDSNFFDIITEYVFNNDACNSIQDALWKMTIVLLVQTDGKQEEEAVENTVDSWCRDHVDSIMEGLIALLPKKRRCEGDPNDVFPETKRPLCEGGWGGMGATGGNGFVPAPVDPDAEMRKQLGLKLSVVIPATISGENLQICKNLLEEHDLSDFDNKQTLVNSLAEWLNLDDQDDRDFLKWLFGQTVKHGTVPNSLTGMASSFHTFLHLVFCAITVLSEDKKLKARMLDGIADTIKESENAKKVAESIKELWPGWKSIYKDLLDCPDFADAQMEDGDAGKDEMLEGPANLGSGAGGAASGAAVKREKEKPGKSAEHSDVEIFKAPAKDDAGGKEDVDKKKDCKARALPKHTRPKAADLLRGLSWLEVVDIVNTQCDEFQPQDPKADSKKKKKPAEEKMSRHMESFTEFLGKNVRVLLKQDSIAKRAALHPNVSKVMKRTIATRDLQFSPKTGSNTDTVSVGRDALLTLAYVLAGHAYVNIGKAVSPKIEEQEGNTFARVVARLELPLPTNANFMKNPALQVHKAVTKELTQALQLDKQISFPRGPRSNKDAMEVDGEAAKDGLDAKDDDEAGAAERGDDDEEVKGEMEDDDEDSDYEDEVVAEGPKHDMNEKKEYVARAIQFLDVGNPAHVKVFPLKENMKLKIKQALLEEIYDAQSPAVKGIIKVMLPSDNEAAIETTILQPIQEIGSKLWTETNFTRIYENACPQWIAARRAGRSAGEAALRRQANAKGGRT